MESAVPPVVLLRGEQKRKDAVSDVRYMGLLAFLHSRG
jgi:hypothetical protein